MTGKAEGNWTSTNLVDSCVIVSPRLDFPWHLDYKKPRASSISWCFLLLLQEMWLEDASWNVATWCHTQSWIGRFVTYLRCDLVQANEPLVRALYIEQHRADSSESNRIQTP